MKKLMYLALALLGLAGGVILVSAAFERPLPPDRGLTIGMNLSPLNYWTRELPFVDVFRTSMPWITQNANRVPGGRNPWSTGVLGSIRFDRDGYPLALPVDVPGTEGPQGVATLMCREIEGRYPAGRYVCLYDGRGEVRFSFDAREASRAPGRIGLDVTPSPAGILLTIASSDPRDRVRNIRVIMPGFEKTCRDRPFNPLFLERLRPFRIIRFMDWQRTNDSTVTSWDTRTLPSSCTQAGPGGVAAELMIALCRELGADPWFCLPHQADDGYLRNFARMARDGIPGGGRIYIEYSNEVWNALFGQYRWVEGHDSRNVAHARKYARFAGRAFGIWARVFGSRKGRLVRVACGQQANPRVLQDALDALGLGGADAASCSAYFGLEPGDYPVLEGFGAGAGPGDVMYLLMGGLERNGVQGIRRHGEIAAEHGLDLLFYEGGQSLVTMPFGSSRPYMPALWKAQQTPEMYLACRTAFGEVRRTHARAYVAYSFVTCASTRSGSWGHLEYLTQPLAEAPKYRALMDEIRAGRP
jgi:hypothetical protein